jgi:copper chaperone NosL
MHLFRPLVILLLALALSFSAVLAATAVAPVPSAKDKCPVCGMFVGKYPDWVVTITFKDSTTLFFDGAKDLFTWYHNMQKYAPGRTKASISTITFNDYYSLKPIDARQAYFVIGSDVHGPMGKELVPFGKTDDAQVFIKDHKGKKALRFNEVTPSILKSME